MSRIVSYFVIIMLLFLSVSVTAQSPNWGDADTLAHHKLGPGVQYSSIYFKGKKMKIWITEVDLNNPLNKIEQVQSNHKVPDLTRWTVQEHFTKNSSPNHQVRVAFNHDFFSYEGGICIGMNVSNGEIPYGSGWGRSLLAFPENGSTAIFHPVLDANVVLPDNSKVKIDMINGAADGLQGNCVLFNRFNALNLTAEGKYLKIKPKGKWTVNGDNIPCAVLELSTTPLQTTPQEYVLFVRNSKLNSFDKLEPGQTILIEQRMTNGKFGKPIENILNAFHGYPSIASQGKLHDGEYNDFENGREYEISSRQMAGISKDGSKLIIITTEMSGSSAGVNCIELANYMLEMGAWDVVNFDSGGSVAIVVDAEMLNEPARGSIRPVMDALLVVSLAPESNEVHSYAFKIPSIRPIAASLTPLTLLEFNEFDEVLNKDVKGFKFSCEPENLGFVDENQIFHAGIVAGSGKIIAEKNGIFAEIKVDILPINNYSINPDKILIDDVRQYPIVVQSQENNNVYFINPAVVNWNVENKAVVRVENGILSGLEEGESKVIGEINGNSKSLNVKVEIAKDKQLAEAFDDISSFEVKSGVIKNVQFSKNELPASWEYGSVLSFDLSAGRAPYLDMIKEMKFYGLPDSLSWLFNNQGGVVKEMIFYLKDAQGADLTYKIEQLGTDLQRLTIPFSNAGKPWGVERFPIKLSKLKIYFNAIETKRYSLPFGGLYAHYPQRNDTKLESISRKRFDFTTTLSNNVLVINLESVKQGNVLISLYSIDGRLQKIIANTCIQTNVPVIKSDISSLKPGIYILKVEVDGIPYSSKILKQ